MDQGHWDWDAMGLIHSRRDTMGRRHWYTIGLVETQWDGAGNTTMGLEHKMRSETQMA